MAKAFATLLLCWLVFNIDFIQGEDILEANTEAPFSSNDDDILPQQEEVVTAKTKDEPCTGCITDINPNVENLTVLVDKAIEDIQKERDNAVSLIQVLQVQRQVVAGVRFTLVLEVGRTICSKNVITEQNCPINLAAPTEFCKIDFLQKPWLTKNKFIVANNCTNAEYSFPEISKPEVTQKPITEPLSEDRLLDLESQILTDILESVDSDNRNFTSDNSPDSQARHHELSNEDKLFLDSFFGNTPEDNWGDEQAKVTAKNPFEDLNALEENVFEGLQIPAKNVDLENSSTSEDINSSMENAMVEQNILRKRNADPNTSEDSKSNETSVSSEEHNQRVKRSQNLDSSIENSASNETSSEEGKVRVPRGTKDSRAQSSLEKNDEKQDVSINTLIKNYDESSDDASSLDDDSITRHKRKADSSSSSSSSSDEEQNNNNLINRNTQKQNLKTQQDNKENNDPNSSSSEDNTNGNINKRSAESDEYDEKVLIFNLAKYVTSLFDGLDEDEYRQIPLSATKQQKSILEGYVYSLKLKIGFSKCKEEKRHLINTNLLEFDPSDIEECKKSLSPDAVKYCKVQVHVPETLTNPKLLDSQCQGNTRAKRHAREEEHKLRTKRQVLVGGISPAPEDDPFIQNLTENTLTMLDGQSPHDNKYKIDKILDASKQVVAGIIYRIKAQIVLSDCPKTSSAKPSRCGVLKEASPQVCDIVIWDRPWLPHGRQTNITCDGVHSSFRNRRSLDNTQKPAIQFIDFLSRFNKKYTSKEELKRRYAIFLQNLQQIKLLNDFELGTAKYGVTKFADLTKEEFKKYYLGLDTSLKSENEMPMAQAEIPDIELPTEFDWRDKGAVTEVKNQGSCGSCWAFSTTGNIEGQYAIKHGKLLEFSEQELVDCDSLDNGCGGGLMDNAYREIEKLGGLELESDYPYDARNEKCHFNKTLARVQLSGALNISQNEDDMAKWLTQNGPIAIAINANAMQFYMGGVSHPWKFLCNPKSLDHGVLIVGYGVHTYPVYNKTLPYWIVKNSWGPKWGEQGYYKVYRGDGTCGVNQTPSSGIVE